MNIFDIDCKSILLYMIIEIFRFITSFTLVDQKKINIAVEKMKDYFITRNGFQAPSRYMIKVFR